MARAATQLTLGSSPPGAGTFMAPDDDGGRLPMDGNYFIGAAHPAGASYPHGADRGGDHDEDMQGYEAEDLDR
ncbi:uncharacterized protein A4U43_UnF4430 [Asparagus officinalis]|uniref:Uncharacterized protein n=1 Tax=Asparagus officinalis TaxID=4686 RepID=A0A1R3L6Y8_ASPOF|nr:uncharacterized protein A4U43_UnF4430 [Asparagus officinalis]